MTSPTATTPTPAQEPSNGMLANCARRVQSRYAAMAGINIPWLYSSRCHFARSMLKVSWKMTASTEGSECRADDLWPRERETDCAHCFVVGAKRRARSL